jgi:hypothetical protein
MGPGWSLSGLSSIARCKRGKEYGDTESSGNPFRAINYSNSDGFCLDGQRLLPVTNSNNCPARSGATLIGEYRTEINTFRRVCAYSVPGVSSGPGRWVVQGKDGTASDYGSTTDSRIEPNYFSQSSGKPFWLGRTDRVATWLVKQVTDTNSSYYTFDYSKRYSAVDPTQYDGEVVLERVSYTGNGVAGKQPYNRVEFSYDEHPLNSQRFDFQGGSILRLVRRLTRVTSYALPSHLEGTSANAVEIRRYDLRYVEAGNGNGLSRLHGVTECAPRPGQPGQYTCYPETRFDWSADNYGMTAFASSAQNWTSFEKAIDSKQGDVNGDGAQDLVWIEDRDCNGNAPDRFEFRLSTSNGLTLNPPTFTDIRIARGLVEQCGTGGYADSLKAKRFGNAWFVYDFNGDGHDDLLLASTTEPFAGPDKWRIHLASYLNNAWVFSTTGIDTGIPSGLGSQSRFADISGDGLPDLLVTSGINGDALPLLVYRMKRVSGDPNGLLLRFVTDGSDGPREVELLKGGAPVNIELTVARRRPIDSIDANGDGRSDLLVPLQIAGGSACSATIDWYVFVSEGVVGTKERFIDYAYVGRVNNAGVPDPLPGGLDIEPGEGCVGDASVQLADINGDSLADLFVRTADKAWAWRPNVGSTSDGVYQGYLPASFFLGLDVGSDGYGDRVQLLDVNGDGELDALFPKFDGNDNDCNGTIDSYPYRVRLFEFAGWADATRELPLMSGGATCFANQLDPELFATYLAQPSSPTVSDHANRG